MPDVPYGYCRCGCGEETRVVRGQPRRFIVGHNRRLSSSVDYVVDENGCWVWQRGRNGRMRYGSISRDGKSLPAHRVYYENFVGPVPEGLVLDHLCRNPACVNPEHLEPVTQRENILRGTGSPAENARKTHCKRGHPLEGENLGFKKEDGARVCRTCRRASSRRAARKQWQKQKRRKALSQEGEGRG